MYVIMQLNPDGSARCSGVAEDGPREEIVAQSSALMAVAAPQAKCYVLPIKNEVVRECLGAMEAREGALRN